MMKTDMTRFYGVTTALVTPFKKGELDLASFRRLLRQQTDRGVRGFVINGTTGESPCLSPEEVKTLYMCARGELGSDATLIIGTGLNSTRKTIEFSQTAASWGPEALLTVVPYYNKPPQRGLQAHFEAVADAVNVPIILYNVPGRTVAGLDAATVGTLSRHRNIIGIKDATGDLNVLKALREEVTPDFVLLSGDDGTCVEFAGRGGHGVISVSSHIIGAEMIGALANPTPTAVEDFHERYAEFMRWLYIEANPIPVKAALQWMGVIDSGELRLPLIELGQQHHKEFQACLKKLGKL
jgi:4-hydroxy-tetrahydrodipicolinate synthase